MASIQDRKLHLIALLARLDDEYLLALIEKLLLGATETLDAETMTDEERMLVRERIAAYHEDPEDEIPWQTVKSQLCSQ